jgi:hypothetical protein
MKKLLLASAVAGMILPAASFEALAAAGNSMITRGTYQTYALHCQVVWRGLTNTIVVSNYSTARVPQGAAIELRVHTTKYGGIRYTRIAHTAIERGQGIRITGVPSFRTLRSCEARVRLGPLTNLVR